MDKYTWNNGISRLSNRAWIFKGYSHSGDIDDFGYVVEYIDNCGNSFRTNRRWDNGKVNSGRG